MNVTKILVLVFVMVPGLVCANGDRSHTIKKRIVNGVPAEISTKPYQVSLSNKKGRFFCGGSIISRTYILTAAHCVDGICLACEVINVRIGSANLDKGGTVIKVKEYHLHPKWNPDFKSCQYDYDVAVLELEKAIPEYTTVARPIALAEKEPRGQEIVQVGGWGLITPFGLGGHSIGSSYPLNLQAINTTVIYRPLCEKMINYFPFIGCQKRPTFTSRMMCIEGDEKGVCSGDSGGPAVFNNTQIGIVSWVWDDPTAYCTSSPSVITNIADPEIRNFINEKANLKLRMLPIK